MKTSKMAKILSAILALAVILCSLPFALGVTASAEGSTTVDYSAMANLLKPAIADYTDTFGMHDGVGLRVKDGALIVDGDWNWQNSIDKYVGATPAYAIYDVAANTEFVANFSETTNTSAMKFYASENMVDWYLVDATVEATTATVNVPYYANYLKLAWPLGANENNGILSVSFVEPIADANDIVINYKKTTTGTSTMVGNGYNDVNVLNTRGVWQSDGINFNGTGVLAPDWTRLNNATSENSFNGYVTYKVQPATRFSMSVTTLRTIDSSWTAKTPSDALALKLGCENPADWNIEIYVSADNVTFTRLDEATLRTMTARYPNNMNDYGNAYRSTEYNFIVPEGMAYVKAKFPMTQNVTAVKDDAGNTIYGGCGNDIFSINKVEFTRFKYDYVKIADGDYYIDSAFSADTMADFGISGYGGGFNLQSCGFDTTYNAQYNNGHATTWASWDVEPGTPFYAGFYTNYQGGLNSYISASSTASFNFKFQGYSNETAVWTDISELVVNSANQNNKYYGGGVSSEENVYDKIRIFWPARATTAATGDDAIVLREVAFTPAQTITYDFTKCTDITTLTTDYGAYSYTSSGNPVKTSTAGLRLGWSELASKSEEGGLPKAYVVYKAESGDSFKVNFYKNNWYNQTYISERWNDPDYTIRVYSSATDTFETKTEHEITYSAPSADNKGINNTIEFDVPFGENYIKIEFPQEGRVSDNKSGNDFTHVGNDFLDIKSVEIGKADLELDWINVDTVPTTGRYYKGDAFNADGLVVSLTYTNGEQRRIDTGFDYEVDTNVVGANLISVSYAGMESSFMVEVYVYNGDFNCDKKVDMLDLIRLKKIAVSEGESDGADADIDGSGEVDGSDLAQMKKFILGAIAEL